ncbi:MAG: AAA family ATPase [Mycobacterium leprae]
MPTLAIAHRDPAVLSTLTAQLGAASTDRSPEVLPTDPEPLRLALEQRQGGWVIVDVDLLPVVVSFLRLGKFRLIVVTSLQGDPRGVKLSESGVPLLLPDQVLPYLSTELTSETSTAEPAPGDAGAPARLVVLHSPKGGAGTTTLAAHLAATWALQGRQIALVDLSPYGSQAMLCKVQQSHQGLERLVAAVEQDDEFLAKTDCDLSPFLTALPVKPGRLDLLTGGTPQLTDRLKGPQVEHLLQRLADQPYDHIVVDTSAEPVARNLAALAAADLILLVAVPDYACGWGLLQLQQLLTIARPVGRQQLVLNRAVNGSGLTATELAGRLNLPVAVVIPEESRIAALNDQGVPWQTGNQTGFGQAVWDLAALLEEVGAGG